MDYVTSNKLRLTDKAGRAVAATELKGKAVALYFSAHWCPPCKGFTPVLKNFYEQVKSEGLEIIFVSSDKSEGEGQEYFANDHGDWLMLEFSQGQAIGKNFAVQGIPSLIVIDSKGKVVAPDARSQVAGAATGSSNMKAVVADWLKSCGDWRETTGSALGGMPAANDADAMRAARLARLGGGPPPTPSPLATPEQPVQVTDVVMETPVAAVTTPVAAVTGPTEPTVAVTVPADPAPMAPGGNMPGVSPEAVAQLTAMGIEETTARNALEAAGGDVERAVEFCF